MLPTLGNSVKVHFIKRNFKIPCFVCHVLCFAAVTKYIINILKSIIDLKASHSFREVVISYFQSTFFLWLTETYALVLY